VIRSRFLLLRGFRFASRGRVCARVSTPEPRTFYLFIVVPLIDVRFANRDAFYQ